MTTPSRHSGAEIAVRLLERQGVDDRRGHPGRRGAAALRRARARAHDPPRARAPRAGRGLHRAGHRARDGRPGVCVASSGPGATNLLTAIADAKLDSIPLVAITGQVPRALIGTDAFQEVDTFGLSLPITKHNFLVRSATRPAARRARGVRRSRPRAGPARC